jgi:hypothetical protein
LVRKTKRRRAPIRLVNLGSEPCGESPRSGRLGAKIVRRARAILDSPAKWNRADSRECPPDAQTFSLYCALEKATDESNGTFEHRGAVMQEARFVIDALAPKANYDHRLMGYNNDPHTTFADIQKVFDLLERAIAKRLAEEGADGAALPKKTPGKAEDLAAMKIDIAVIQRARVMLDAPAKWNRAERQDIPPDATFVGLFGALALADKEVTGTFDERCAAMKEARHLIDELAPNHKTYKARLVEYNNDASTSFSDIQKLLQLAEERLVKRLAAASTDPAR